MNRLFDVDTVMSAAGPTNFPVISLISRESNPVERIAPDRSQPINKVTSRSMKCP
jgi:hypothetical protein